MKNLKYTCSNMCSSFWCESSVLSDFNIYANIYRKFLKKKQCKWPQMFQCSTQQPVDYNEKTCIFDSENKAIKIW